MDEPRSEGPSDADARYQKLRERMVAGEEGVDFYIHLGYAALEAGHREEGVECLKKALKRDPTRAFLLAKLQSLCPPSELEGLIAEPARGSYLRMVLGSLRYPFRGRGLATILLGSAFFFILRAIAVYTAFRPIGLLILAFVAGYLVTYFFSVMKATAVVGSDEPPDWPDIFNPFDVVIDFAKVIAAHIAAFLPMAAAWLLTAYSGGGGLSFATIASASPLTLALAAFGIVYYPMALIATGMHETILACFNPFFIVRSIAVMVVDYLVMVGFVLAAGVTFVAFEYVVLVEMQLSYLAVGFFILIIEMILGMATMRAAGLLYRCNRSRLGWFV